MMDEKKDQERLENLTKKELIDLIKSFRLNVSDLGDRVIEEEQAKDELQLKFNELEFDFEESDRLNCERYYIIESLKSEVMSLIQTSARLLKEAASKDK